MKTLLTLLLLTLICFLYHISAGPIAPGLMVRAGCCEKYNRTPIPKGKVTHVGRTADNCSVKAIVVITVCNKKYCIDPSWTWAKRLLSEFKQAIANTTSPRAPFNQSKCDKTPTGLKG
ncbi:C-C motif chemokine 17-like [Trachinotus anak]|uniref:C-C motif chemokine 17-like n=1 Tax=Trachinotus anak TaxID=443729 RepID=UPI0039F1C695